MYLVKGLSANDAGELLESELLDELYSEQKLKKIFFLRKFVDIFDVVI
jgi:hypothetical protein